LSHTSALPQWKNCFTEY